VIDLRTETLFIFEVPASYDREKINVFVEEQNIDLDNASVHTISDEIFIAGSIKMKSYVQRDV
jgi:hypothetical protein